MKEIKCEICGKIIEGYSDSHVELLLMQHKVVHREKPKEESK